VSDRLPRDYYRRDAVELATALLGQKLVRVHDGVRLTGLIVEVEAYLGVVDRAAHTYAGRRTARNASMWAEGGHAYVYFTYGLHHCFNVVAGRQGDPVAVLVRALEPVEGLDEMARFRLRPGGNGRDPTRRLRPTELCSGPAKLCQAMWIDRSLDGADLVRSDELFIERVRRRSYPASRIGVGPRVGVAYAGEWARKPLRFFLADNPHVSRA
jgi:DNA-3-methyladenine glycosylase